MSYKEFTSLPTNYPVCELSNCPMATTCLHHVAYSIVMEQNKEYLHLINPNRCSKNESCTYYRNKKPIVYARGFTSRGARSNKTDARKGGSRLLDGLR